MNNRTDFDQAQRLRALKNQILPGGEKLPSPSELDAERAAAKIARQEWRIHEGRMTLRAQINGCDETRDLVVDEPADQLVALMLYDELVAAGWVVKDQSIITGEESPKFKRQWLLVRPEPQATPSAESDPAVDGIGGLPEHPAPGDLYRNTETGTVYEVYTLVRDMETGEILVVYDRTDRAKSDIPWSRPLAQFSASVNGAPRFKHLPVDLVKLAEHAAIAATTAKVNGGPPDVDGAWESFVAQL